MHHVLKIMLALTLTGGAPKKDAIPLHLAGQFDAATTVYFLNHCPTGSVCQEENPLFRPVASTKFAYPVMWLADDGYLASEQALRYRGHSRWATALEIGAIALHVYCGIHNIRGAHSLPSEPIFHVHRGGTPVPEPQDGVTLFVIR